ncbi:hypothetical protein TRIP_C90104 [Candidatus Zixiibacteriota bacterium]|nr:hypothetical protein TRIP_C90104 [candidate division Zixibacteria bacterium]
MKFRFHNDKILVDLRSSSDLGSEKDDYHLRIRVDSKFPEYMKHSLKFVPESVKVYVEEHLMRHDSIWSSPFEDTLSNNKYAVGLDYAYDMRTDSLIVASVYQRKGFKLRIIMDNFIYYNAQPLHFDTIVAVERQPFLY